jgi:hypothetical protein
MEKKRSIDMKPYLHKGTLFRALQDSTFLEQVVIDPLFGGLEWPNGADICPDTAYEKSIPISRKEDENV